MFSFICSLFAISLFVVLPLCFSADYPGFIECSQPFECGTTVTNLYYPFWGNGRAEYCGHPDFKLECKDDSIVELEVGLQSYRVLDFDEENHILHITTTELLKNCPSPSQNISLPSPIFNYSLPGTMNLTLAYGCPPYPQRMPNNRYPCSIDDISGENYFWVGPATASPDLSNCNLTVTIPVLRSVDQSLNMVMDILKDGFEVRYDANDSFCRTCGLSQGQCGYDITSRAPTCLCYDGQYQGACPTVRSPKKGPNSRKKVAIGVFSAIGGVILVVTFLLVYYRIKKSGKLLFFGETAATRNFEQFIKRHGSFAPKRYSFKEIKKMTQSFKNKLGHGGYGSVFKGVLNDGRLVAVKVLTDIKGNGEEFINEVASISRTSHVNIVSLLGYCFDGSKRALIYEYMPNGSLEKYIYDKDSSIAYANLGWATLHDISVGIARGLEYLHRGCNTRILHFDIKPHNILLDQDFCPKISDFGLAKLCPRKDSIISMLGTRGTAGYIAPEVFSRNFGSVSNKSDVYSYGMMILEMVGGRKNIDIRVDHTSEIYFPNWIYKRIALNEDLALHGIDSKAQEDIPRKMILVGLWCIQTNPFDRPAMTRVLEMLEGNMNVLEIPPKPYLSSPPRTQGSSSIN